jgi:Tfp pilus assembly protein PilX
MSGLRLRLRRDQRGYVIVTVLLLLLVGLLLGAVAIAESLDSRTHANRDARSIRAQQAADAGIQSTLYAQNQLDLGSLDLNGGQGALANLVDCSHITLSASLQVTGIIGAAANANGVCQPPCNTASTCTGTSNPSCPVPCLIPAGDHSGYETEFVPGASATNSDRSFKPKIVSVGVDWGTDINDTAHYVIRREEAVLAPIDPFKTLEANHDLAFQVTAATTFNGTARAAQHLDFDLGGLPAGAFTMTNLLGGGGHVINSPNIDVGCGTTYQKYNFPFINLFAIVAVGGTINYPNTCGSGFFNRPAISMSSAKANCSSTCPTAAMGYVAAGDYVYNTNALTTITLQPGDYVFCGFQTNGPVVPSVTATSAPVRIFIDSPTSSRCASSSPPALDKGNFYASQGISNALGATQSQQVQVYVVGNGTDGQFTSGTTNCSRTNSGTAVIAGPASLAQAFFIYAPTSCVQASSTVAIAGSIIGWDVSTSSILYTQDPGLSNYSFANNVAAFRPIQYIECPPVFPLPTSGSTATDPTSGC